MRSLIVVIILGICSIVLAAVTTLNSFSKGEISPRLEGRTDTKAYYSACRTAENVLILAQGGVTKRPGTAYISDSEAFRLITFEYSVDDTYIISIADGNMYFYRTTD